MFPKYENISIRLIISLFILFCHCSNLLSQNYFIKSFTTENGLPHNNVRDIAIDSSGFMWIATWDGLSRYDGYDFKNYYHVPGDSTSLPYFSVSKICVDGANNLWLLTDLRQVVLFSRKDEKFKVVDDFGKINPGDNISISLDENKNLWIIGSELLVKMDYKTGIKNIYKLNEADGTKFSIGPGIYNVSLFEDGKIWIGGITTYVFRFDGNESDGYKLTRLKTYSLGEQIMAHPLYFDHTMWFSLYKTSDQNIWIFSNYGLFLLDKELEKFISVEKNIPVESFTGRKMFCWGSFTKGLLLYFPDDKKSVNIPLQESNLIKSVCMQTDKLIWFAGSSATGVPMGLKRLIITPDIFRDYPIEESEGSNSAIFSILKDSLGTIWTSIRGVPYITRLKPDGKVKKEFILSPLETQRASHIRTMIEVSGGIWLGYMYNNLLFYDMKRDKYTSHLSASKVLSTITIDKKGLLYIGAVNIECYDPATRKSKTIYEGEATSFFYKLYFDSKGYLWGTMNFCKLIRLDINTGKFDEYRLSNGNYNVEDIIEDKDGNFWFTLLGGGICRFNPETGVKKFYTTSSGLSNNTTYCLLFDSSGMLWITTDNGISRFNPTTEKFRNFDKNDGLKINEFNSDAKFTTADGEFLFGGMGGIVGFYPDRLNISEKSKSIQKLIITDISISGEKRSFNKPVYDCDTIKLLKGENNFQITFATTDFEFSDRILYRYQLKGLSDKWIEEDSKHRSINYSHLKPGWYTLNTEITGRDGNWETSKHLHIKITAYFYKTRVFAAIIVLLLCGVITLLITLYVKHINTKAAQKNDQMRLQALRGQMNPHFIFNSLNSINYFISNNDKMSANRYIVDFSRLIRSILSNLEADYIPFEVELTSLNDYLNIEHLRFGDKFDFEIVTNDTGQIKGLEVFPGLIQPFIENAIWHGVRSLEKRKAFIKIKFSMQDMKSLVCTIEDDGVGRKASMENRLKNMVLKYHQPKGIGIVLERLQLISKQQRKNYSLDISDLFTDRDDTGTKVTIDIPFIITDK